MFRLAVKQFEAALAGEGGISFTLSPSVKRIV